MCVGVYEAENGHGNRFQKVEQMFDEWVTHRQPTCSVLGLLKTVPGLCELNKKTSMCWVLEFVEINGLSCVEIDRLIHDSNVLSQ